MATDEIRYRGGCLCGALRYEARGKPAFAGHCYCADCRKASGSGFIPFMGFAAESLTFTGSSQIYSCPAANGNIAVRNFCKVCGSLVFGGEVGKDDSFTLYAGSLDDPSQFSPTVAIFTQGHPDWASIPPHLKIFERAPN
jgi:hypothetical protein